MRVGDERVLLEVEELVILCRGWSFMKQLVKNIWIRLSSIGQYDIVLCNFLG
jgi:hypothetical protein